MSRKLLGFLGAFAVIAGFGLPVISPKPLSAAEDDRIAMRSTLEGTWHKRQGQFDHIKLITATKYVNTWVKDGVLVHAFGGKCRIEGNKYTETVEFVAPTALFGTVGKSSSFVWTVTGDKARFVGDLEDETGKKVTFDATFEHVK